MEPKGINILTTGGTIEKSYSEYDGTLSNRHSLLKKKLLSKMRLPHTSVHLTEVMAKDSLDMTEQDRELILQSARREVKKGYPLLILHGTDTMADTAHYFYEKMPKPECPVVFTGAMKPLGFEDSDAFQNFVEAMTVCHLVPPGIYISFHNHVFTVPGVLKNKKRRTFEKSK